ncbi:MAG: tRNA-dihydrouridine synthase family protein [Bacteroidetes bacterium]|nr:tRNA-dihydrouridine synthase family protein [Bacteroidota bacterium]
MLFLAPIQGFTEHRFRNAFHRHFGGIDLAIAPFVTLVKGKRVHPNHFRDLLPENNIGMNVIPQVIGNDPELFIMMARDLSDLGYKSINWNLGCPKEQVARKQRGSGLLPHPEKIDAILEKIIPAIPVTLSVKTRLGYSNPDEIDRLIPVFNRYPLDYVVIHPRTGIQMYEGDLHLHKMGSCLQSIRHPLIYSGDIYSKVDYLHRKKEYREISDWMLGRGLLANLFLAEEIAGIPTGTETEKKGRFKRFHDDLFRSMESSGARERHFTNKIKEYWKFFSRMFENPSDMFDRLKVMQTKKNLYQQISLLIEECIMK